MPKMKSNSGAKKRFTRTASGKVKFKKAYHSHILTKKSQKRKRKMRKAAIMVKPEQVRVNRLLPYFK